MSDTPTPAQITAAAHAIAALNTPGALPDNISDGEAYRLFARAALEAAQEVARDA